MLVTAAATMLAPMGHLPAHGAAPLIGKQAPSYYRYKVGSYEVTVVSDGARPWPLDMVRATPQRRRLARRQPQSTDMEKVTFPYVPIVVNTAPS